MDELTSAQACSALGIRPQTLYAYVSRGVLTPRKEGRRSWFAATDVEALAQRTARGRRPGRVDLSIESAITFLDPRGQLLYRGVDVGDIARRWSFERTAVWLWTGVDRDEPGPWVADPDSLELARRVQSQLDTRTPLQHRVRVAAAVLGARDSTEAARLEAASAIATIVESLPLRGRRPADGADIAARLWPRLTALVPDGRRVAALRTALVAFADHELATSTLAVRVATSTSAWPLDAILAGLATMGGGRDGGAQRYTRRLVREICNEGAVAPVERALDRWGVVPGVGHAVYTAGDPRVRPLLAALHAAGEREVLSAVAALEDEIGGRRGLGPLNADTALAALAEAYEMGPGAGEAIVAVARMAGWWAHAAEESKHRLRFRPRAVYTGDRG